MKDLELLDLPDGDEMTMTDRLIIVKYKYNSPVKAIRKIINEYEKLKKEPRK